MTKTSSSAAASCTHSPRLRRPSIAVDTDTLGDAEIDERDDHHDDRKDHGERNAVALLALVEGLLDDPGGGDFGGPKRAAIGHGEEEIEPREAAGDRDEDADKDVLPKERQRDAEEAG